jgi:hypothetical protein
MWFMHLQPNRMTKMVDDNSAWWPVLVAPAANPQVHGGLAAPHQGMQGCSGLRFVLKVLQTVSREAGILLQLGALSPKLSLHG